MECNDAIIKLGLTDGHKISAWIWELSQRSATEPLHFNPESVREAAAYICLDGAFANSASQMAARVKKNPALQAVFLYARACAFGIDEELPPVDWETMEGMLPSLAAVLGEQEQFFWLLLLLSQVPALKLLHKALSIPTIVVEDTFDEVRFWLERRKEFEPTYAEGLLAGGISWLVNHFRGDLYKLGLLQFQFGEFPDTVKVFRNRQAGRVLALIDSRISNNNKITGRVVSPEGRAEEWESTLQSEDWESVLQAGDPVLHVHIPGGGIRLTPEACADSFAKAVIFYPQYFPKRLTTAFCCESWLLDSQLTKLLPGISNIVRFQQEWYLYPGKLNSQHLLAVAFGRVPSDLSEAPRDTGLRRALCDHVLSGGKLEPVGGRGFLLWGDLHWGERPYQLDMNPA